MNSPRVAMGAFFAGVFPTYFFSYPLGIVLGLVVAASLFWARWELDAEGGIFDKILSPAFGLFASALYFGLLGTWS